ncbi:MAG: DUF420 domain-containing protein [Calditrichaeota bacterium]|nr:MAG: DUF420 domain-containing protein [Calditrichota bacterium]MBL1206632.1 DUF420 domain-containing protein [Calditrichota bacterium]NOG46459.1 DUF420 domain-containing protein [Calditrichota bacterium]
MEIENLATLNALLNGIAAIMLSLGFISIRKANKVSHKKFMISALIISAMFLISYLFYHYNVGSVPYPYHDWTRPVYFGILIPHIIFAGINVPFILSLVYFAFKGKFVNHKKLARWVWPVWMYVSVTGVIIYFMNYIL